MVRKAAERLGRNFRVLADETQQIEIFFGSLARQLVEHFGLYFRAQDGANFFVPAGIDAIELLRARVDQPFDDAALLVETRRRQRAALDGIENAKEMLPFAKNN